MVGGLLLACAFIVILVNFALLHQRQIVEFDSDAVDSFGRRYGAIALIGFGCSEALNFLFSSLGLKNRILLYLPSWLMILCVSYVLYAANLAVYRYLTSAARNTQKR